MSNIEFIFVIILFNFQVLSLELRTHVYFFSRFIFITFILEIFM
jgi:hypothetical protein